MPKIPWYVPVPLEELARAAFIAAVSAVITAAFVSIQSQGIPDTPEKWTAIAVAALGAGGSAAWAAIRTGLNKTPLTPPDAGDTPAGVGAGG